MSNRTKLKKYRIKEIKIAEMSEMELLILKKKFLGWHRIILPVLAYFVFAAGLAYQISTDNLDQGAFYLFILLVGLSIGLGIFSFFKSIEDRNQAIAILEEAERRFEEDSD